MAHSDADRDTWFAALPHLTEALSARCTSPARAAQLRNEVVDAFLALVDLAATAHELGDALNDPQLSEVRLLAMGLVAATDAGQSVGAIQEVLTDRERLLAQRHIDDLVGEGAVELTAVRVPRGLAAGGGTRVRHDRPVVHTFRIVGMSEEASVEVQLGSGVLEIRQLSGPALRMSGADTPLPHADTVDVEVADGTELAAWLGSRLEPWRRRDA